MDTFEIAEVIAQQAASGRAYLEFLRAPALSLGLYVLPADGLDPQQPHREDEVYYVINGQGMITVGQEDHPVEPGSIVFVGAGVEHRFHSIREELKLLVFFAPAESS
jgi:mannose-6-phosphate isomerase-like protein (cupin superfamily)